jgi:predicted nucleic acid-binding protein
LSAPAAVRHRPQDRARSICDERCSPRGSAHAAAEGEDHLPRLEPLALDARIRGATIRDAHVAAICLTHGVAELWSADRDFARFRALTVRNPLIG